MPTRDGEGFLVDLDSWSPEVAELLADEASIQLTADHWQVIELARDFYREFRRAPAMRPLVNLLRDRYGTEKGNSIHVMRLFPERPIRLVSRISGLPKPPNCD